MGTQRVRCPKCGKWEATRILPPEPGYGAEVRHYACDDCKVGWYQRKGARRADVAPSYLNLPTFDKKLYMPQQPPLMAGERN